MKDRIAAEVFPPGEFIKDALDARGWSQIDLAEIIGRNPNVVSELIMGKRSITPETAKALGEAFDTTAQLWLNLESAYQLFKARTESTENIISRRAKLYQIAPIKEMVKRHWIEPSENVDVLEKRVVSFFGIKSVDDKIGMDHAARRGTENITSSQWAWIFRAKQLAYGIHAKPFSAQSFERALVELKTLLSDTPEARRVSKILADNGIRFLVVEQLPHTKIDGVTFWLDNKSPVIVLSLRYDRIDYFWYTLAHELCHVKRRDGLTTRGIILDTELVGENIQSIESSEVEAEKEADFFATEYLVGHDRLNSFILRKRPLYSKQKVVDFANVIQVHPGIVVGQLQFKKEIPWSAFRLMLDKVRNIVTQSTLTDGWGYLAPILDSRGA